MPTVYVKKLLYDELIKRGFDDTEFINEAIKEKLVRLGYNPAKFVKLVKPADSEA